MKTLRLVNILTALVFTFGLLGGAYQPAAAQTDEEAAQFVPGEVVIGFAEGQKPAAYTAQASALATTVGAQVVGQYANMALLSFAEDADVAALVAQLSGMAGVKYAEPNYIYGIPEEFEPPSRPEAITDVTRRAGSESFTVPVEVLKSLRTVKRNSTIAAYPNDPSLWTNWGWSYVGADILIGNTTAMKNVCVLDTGVDSTHPDLAGKIIEGFDFVNNDADPMDDDGHGTHVSGIIGAVQNNLKGIAGVAYNAKIVAVKVLNAQGWGTNFGVAAGITFCANRTDVNILSMSLGGGASAAVQAAVAYAVNTKNKLVVASAGNSNSSTPSYPAGYSTTYPDKVLAVAATDDGSSTTYGCRASYSNYGSWVSVAAPGTNIFSTLPWNTPFYLGYYYGYYAGYDYLSGTSMSAPFVSAAAARRWGYKPAETNAQIGNDVRTISPFPLLTDGACWPASMAGKKEVNVAALLDRGAAFSYTYNATTGLPLTNATFAAYTGSTSLTTPGVLRGTGIVSSTFSGYAEVLNLPLAANYWGWTNFAGYTTGYQWTFWAFGAHTITGGMWTYFGRGYVPNKDGNFANVAGWKYEWDSFNGQNTDLDNDVWLPVANQFIVGPEGTDWAPVGDRTGSLLVHPYAIYNRDGGWADWMPMESITIRRRASPATLPWYQGTYYIGITDYGQSSYAHTLLYDAQPYDFIWKDGKILNAAWVVNCNAHWWFPWSITSGASGTPTINWITLCTNVTPYASGFESSNINGVIGTTGNVISLPNK